MDDASLTLVQTWDEACAFKEWLGEKRDWLALDCETTGLNVGTDYVRLVQLGDERAAFAFDFWDWRGLLREVLSEQYRGDIVLHNSLFDTKFLKQAGIAIPQRWVHDTMIMGHLVDPVRSNRLKDVAARLLGPQARGGQDALKTAFKQGGWDFATIPTDHPAYWQYSAMDCVITARVAAKLWPQMQRHRNIYETELAFIHLLRDAEIAGLLIDPEYCERAATKYETRLRELNDLIPCDVMSPAQVTRLLQGQGAVLTKRAKGGALATDDEVLTQLAPQFPVAAHIMEYRTAYNISQNYLRKMLNMRDARDRVHPSTKPVGARTGRTSVTDPPLQTVPRGRIVRDAFIPGEGNLLLRADYDGMEMRFMAGDAKCEAMIEAYGRGEDVHRWVASRIYGVERDEVTKMQRQVAKGAAFAIIYGAGTAKFAVTAGVEVAEAEAFLGRYHELFPEIRPWQERIMTEVMRRKSGRDWGYVETAAGRHLPVEPGEEYKAINYRDQGSCAEIAKERAVALDAAGLGDYFRLFVHDEFILEVPEEDAADAAHQLEEVMTDAHTFPDLTFTASSEIVHRWGDVYHDEVNELLEGAHA